MKIITWILRIIVLLVLMWLALLNKDPATFTVLEGIQITLPLIVFLLAFFVLGVILGLLMLLPKYWGSRWEARKLRKENEQNKVLLAQQKSPIAAGNALNETAQTELPPYPM